MRKPIAWMKELVPQKGLEWQVVLTAHEEMAKDWEQPVIQLYTKQEWVGLTDEERDYFTYIDAKDKARFRKYFDYIEAKLKEKNTHD